MTFFANKNSKFGKKDRNIRFLYVSERNLKKKLKFSELELFFVYLLKIWPSCTQGAFIDQKKIEKCFLQKFLSKRAFKTYQKDLSFDS